MRPALLVVAVVLALGAAVALWPRDTTPAQDACGPVDKQPQAVGADVAGRTTLCLLNRERTSRGLPALRENAILDQASFEHSDDMVKRDYFEHTAPDGLTVGDRLRAAGYAHGVNASGGENIAYGVGRKATPRSIVRAWMDSPPHRADILRKSFTEIGIGIAVGAPEVDRDRQADSATYTTDFGGVPDPTLPNG